MAPKRIKNARLPWPKCRSCKRSFNIAMGLPEHVEYQEQISSDESVKEGPAIVVDSSDDDDMPQLEAPDSGIPNFESISLEDSAFPKEAPKGETFEKDVSMMTKALEKGLKKDGFTDYETVDGSKKSDTYRAA